MITIIKDKRELIVTKGAYMSMYAPQGWTIKTDKIIQSTDKIIEPVPEFSYESIDVEEPEISEEKTKEIDLSEIPISEMSVAQLKLYGKTLGVEVNSDSAKTLRSRIRKVLEG